MAIPQSRYVDIDSGLIGTSPFQTREFILRLATENPLVPPQMPIFFTSAQSVGEYFGVNSIEYLQSVYYFSYKSPVFLNSPSSISFAKYVTVDSAPMIFGVKANYSLSDFTSIIDGSFNLTLGGISQDVLGMDFSADLSLSDVANTVQTAIQASNIDPLFASANVIFDAVEGQFIFAGGSTGSANIKTDIAAAGTNILPNLGWDSTAIFIYGADAQTLIEFVQDTVDQNNNFGTLAFIPDLNVTQDTELATFFANENFRYLYATKSTSTTSQSYSDNLKNEDGLGAAVTLYDSNIGNEYPWLLPAIIFSSTDFNTQNSIVNYMFKYNQTTPTVNNESNANFYDNLNINYVGNTQYSGNDINFYQKGVLIGQSNNTNVQIGVYTNEIWLKDAAEVSLLNLLVGSENLPANRSGIARVTNVLQEVIDKALFNGVISVGNVLSTEKKSQIASLTNDPLAYIDVQTNGYWLNVRLTEPSPDVFEIDYLLVYAKNNSVLKITGTHAIA